MEGVVVDAKPADYSRSRAPNSKFPFAFVHSMIHIYFMTNPFLSAAILRHDDIVKWRGEWLRARYDALTEALRAALPGWTWLEPDGGLTLWVRLPGEADGGAFAQAALRRRVAVVPGRLLSASSQASGYLRLAFTQAPDVLARSAVALAAASGSGSRGTGPVSRLAARAVPISPFLVTRAASSSAASPSAPGRPGPAAPCSGPPRSSPRPRSRHHRAASGRTPRAPHAAPARFATGRRSSCTSPATARAAIRGSRSTACRR